MPSLKRLTPFTMAATKRTSVAPPVPSDLLMIFWMTLEKRTLFLTTIHSPNNSLHEGSLPQFIPLKTNTVIKLTPLSNVLDVYTQVVQNSEKTCPDGIVEFLTATGPAARRKEDKNENGDGDSDSHLLHKSASRIRVVWLSQRYFCYIVLLVSRL